MLQLGLNKVVSETDTLNAWSRARILIAFELGAINDHRVPLPARRGSIELVTTASAMVPLSGQFVVLLMKPKCGTVPAVVIGTVISIE